MYRSEDYQRGWNRAYHNMWLPSTVSDELLKGFNDFNNAPLEERGPFAVETPGMPDINAMQAMLVKCMKRFELYAANHRAKGTAEGDKKARENIKFALEIKEVLCLK